MRNQHPLNKPTPLFNTPQVDNWKKNIVNGLDQYFWDDAIYYFTDILDSFTPFMRLCVELRIEGKKTSEISKLVNASYITVARTLRRAKQRLIKAIL